MVGGIWSEQQSLEENAQDHSCPASSPESHSSSHLLQLWFQEVSTLVQGKYDGKTFNKNSNNNNIKLKMQSCQNDIRAMTPCFYVSNERASFGLVTQSMR